MLQGKAKDKNTNDVIVGKDNVYLDEENLNQRSVQDDQGCMKGVLGNPREMRRDINFMKEQI